MIDALARGVRWVTVDAAPMSRPILGAKGFESLDNDLSDDVGSAVSRRCPTNLNPQRQGLQLRRQSTTLRDGSPVERVLLAFQGCAGSLYQRIVTVAGAPQVEHTCCQKLTAPRGANVEIIFQHCGTEFVIVRILAF
jgi:hypothetical protein